MSRFTTVVLTTITIALAIAMPGAAQPRANIVAPVPSINSYDVSARNMVRLKAFCVSTTSYCTQTMQSELATPYVVPQGKRLVITGYSGFLFVPTGSLASASFATSGNTGYTLGVFVDLRIANTNYAGFDYYVANGSITSLYVDQGETVVMVIDSTTSIANSGIYAWGYLVDCTGGVCTKG